MLERSSCLPCRRSDSVTDPRTLHTADTAVDIKWVSQQWIACGFDPEVAAKQESASLVA